MPVSVTKCIQKERPVDDAYALLADPATMPKWATHNVKSIKLVGDGRWEMDTTRGPGYFVPNYQEPTAFSITISSTQAKVSGRSRPGLFRSQICQNPVGLRARARPRACRDVPSHPPWPLPSARSG
jgi:hypothetical protein